MKKLLSAAVLAFASMAAMAQTATKDMTEAEVRKVDKDAKKLTLKHGPIKNLDMPGMTMVFQVKDPAMLENLAVGDKIKVRVKRQQGAFVVTAIEKTDAK